MYLEQLWREIKENSPPDAKFIRDMHVNFGSRLWTFRWKKKPRVVLCKYERKVA